jgi:hypothetical protein
MSRRIKIALATLIGLLIICATILSGPIFRVLVKYSATKPQETILLVDGAFQSEIKDRRDGKDLDLDQIIRLSRTITNQKLKFTFKEGDLKNPNDVEKIDRAHCVGYAAMFTSIASYLIDLQDSEHEYQVKHLRGKLLLLGFDIHPKNRPFLANHDYCEIKNLQSGQIVWVDPSLSDYTLINRVSVKTK